MDVGRIVDVRSGSSGPAAAHRLLVAGPGDEDDDGVPIGDPPDDDEGDDWDDEDDEEEDEDPLQAVAILRRSIAMDEASRHNGVRLTGQ